MDNKYEGLVLTRCDRCNARQWCAVEGTALCRRCCPASVEAVQQEAREARLAREAQLAREREEALWVLPPSESEPCSPVPWSAVARHFHWGAA
jgi:hypothetical protein